jgi:hypothetical protein
MNGDEYLAAPILNDVDWHKLFICVAVVNDQNLVEN